MKIIIWHKCICMNHISNTHLNWTKNIIVTIVATTIPTTNEDEWMQKIFLFFVREVSCDHPTNSLFNASLLLVSFLICERLELVLFSFASFSLPVSLWFVHITAYFIRGLSVCVRVGDFPHWNHFLNTINDDTHTTFFSTAFVCFYYLIITLLL